MERIETSAPIGERQESSLGGRQDSSNPMGSRQQSALSGVGIKVSWTDLEYTVDTKKILRGCTGSAFPGRTLAVMGGSGAGKTTLLNAIGDRLMLDQTHVLEGSVLLNEVRYHSDYKRCIAFVTQDDIVSPLATPSEALFFSARIRKGLSVKHAAEDVEEVIQELGLQKCRDTVVGIPGILVGLSGGEKKRTNIGVELISRPKVLILDEPTSGLDSITSLKLVTQLREIAQHSNRTIIYSIHQPTAEMLQQFDDLLLMIHGKTIYHGPTHSALRYFAHHGFVCPATHTPTDYFMALMQDESLKDQLISNWENDGTIAPMSPSAKRVIEDTSATAQEVSALLREYSMQRGSSYLIQFVELFRRAWVESIRNKVANIALISQGVVFGLIAGLIFINIKHDVTGLQDLQGLFFMVAANKAFSGAMGVVNTFPKERSVYIREQQAGAYSPVIYFLSKILSALPMHLLANMLETIIVYFLCDLHRAGLQFFVYYFATFFVFELSIGIGLAISAAMDDIMVATAMTPMLIVPMLFTGGLLGSTSRIDPYWVWLKHLSIIRYVYVILMKNELETINHVECNPDKFSEQFCSRQPQNGTAALHIYDLKGAEDANWVMWTQLGVFDILVMAIAIFMLYKAGKKRF